MRQHAAGVDLGRDAGELCVVAQLGDAVGDHAAIGAGRLGPGELDDVEALGEAVLALLVGDAVGVVGARKGAAADAEDEPSPLIWSIVAVSSARRSGWPKGRICTAVPILIRLVRAAIALATINGAVTSARVGFIWISASQTASRPHSSAVAISAKDCANASGCDDARVDQNS